MRDNIILIFPMLYFFKKEMEKMEKNTYRYHCQNLDDTIYMIQFPRYRAKQTKIG